MFIRVLFRSHGKAYRNTIGWFGVKRIATIEVTIKYITNAISTTMLYGIVARKIDNHEIVFVDLFFGPGSQFYKRGVRAIVPAITYKNYESSKFRLKPACGKLNIDGFGIRSDEHTSELQSLMRISYDVLCLK